MEGRGSYGIYRMKKGPMGSQRSVQSLSGELDPLQIYRVRWIPMGIHMEGESL